MKILLISGTGTLGRKFSLVLSEQKHDIYITSRTFHKDDGLIHYLIGNPHNSIFLKDILHLYNWDAIIDFMVYSTQEFNLIVDVLLNSCKHYFFFSSGRVFENSEQPLTEESIRLLDKSTDLKFLQTDDYALLKARQENILKKHKLHNYTIIRPYITYGEDRLQLGAYEHEYWLRRVMSGKCMVLPKEIAEKRTTLTYSLDVARIVSQMICIDAFMGETYNVTTSTSIRWRDVMNIYLKVLNNRLGIQPKVVYLINNHMLDNYQTKFDRMYDRIFNNNKIKSCVNVDFFTEPTRGLESCLLSFLDRPYYRNLSINWIEEGMVDKETGDFENLSNIPGVMNKIKYVFFRLAPFNIQNILFKLRNKLR